MYDWLLFLHIVAAMAWVGGLLVLTVVAASVIRGAERDALARFVRSLRIIGPVVLAPASVSVIGFGIWMVVDSDAWDFGQAWILLALGLFAAAFLIGAVSKAEQQSTPSEPLLRAIMARPSASSVGGLGGWD
jgi:uncharacterized membrane protein